MANSASIAGHPIHPMLVPLPIGLWIFSLASDCIYRFNFGGPLWNDIALYTMIAGVAGGLVAVLPGIVDYRALTDPRTLRLARMHMAMNVAIIMLYAVNAWLRLESGPHAVVPIILSFLGVLLLGISGWLGGEMVYVHGVGVKKTSAARSRA